MQPPSAFTLAAKRQSFSVAANVANPQGTFALVVQKAMQPVLAASTAGPFASMESR